MIGSRLRSLRQQQGLTLRQLAAQTGVSAALLSQIENGRTDPSVATLRKLATTFDAELSSLFHEPDAPPVHVSRPGHRFRLVAPAGMITYERLTPGRGDLELLRAVLAPGDVSAETPWSHEATEALYVLDGEIVAEVDGRDHVVTAGEAISFDSRLAHRYRNDSGGPATFILAVTPPTP